MRLLLLLIVSLLAGCASFPVDGNAPIRAGASHSDAALAEVNARLRSGRFTVVMTDGRQEEASRVVIGARTTTFRRAYGQPRSVSTADVERVEGRVEYRWARPVGAVIGTLPGLALAVAGTGLDADADVFGEQVRGGALVTGLGIGVAIAGGWFGAEAAADLARGPTTVFYRRPDNSLTPLP